MSTEYRFQGWLAHDTDAADGNLEWGDFEPKNWAETDIDIKVTHCGMCGTDLHTLHNMWNATTFPCCVGHEIVGHVVRAGSETEFQVNERVGVGPQSDSCGKPECYECSLGLENHCKEIVPTYNGKYRDGSVSMGGYANYCRVPARFAFKIPAGIASAHAAPMLCAGISMYSPLKQNGAGPGKRVGIVGIGGLGHFGLLFAKAMGCTEVVAISRNSSKLADARKMGADRLIATLEENDWAEKHADSLDLIISTIDMSSMDGFMKLLRAQGMFVQVGVPEPSTVEVNGLSMMYRGHKIMGSVLGPPREIQEMLQFVADRGITPWVQERPLKEANQAVKEFAGGNARYRWVLVNND